MKATEVLKSIIGDEIYESLNKALVKLGTKSVVDLDELHSAMKTAPKAVIAFLMKELKDMEKDSTKDIDIPWDETAKMTITKMDADVYKGLIRKDGKIIHEFDLTAIPQLAAHIMSAFEIYGENENAGSEPQEESRKEESDSNIYRHLQSLDNKVNALMMMIASQSPMQKAEDRSKNVNQLLENGKNNYKPAPDLKKKFIDAVKGLKKAGLAPKMPSPPKAGANVGGKQGLTMAGMHGDKTAATDFQAKPKNQTSANPFLNPPKPKLGQPAQAKQPKLAQSEKTMTVAKSELLGNCADCGMSVGDCACFKALSRPEVKKSEGSHITLKFKSDWDQESIQALYKSIKRIRE